MRTALLICALTFVTYAPAWAGSPSSFEAVMEHYEPIRLALLEDSLKGVAEHGKAIAGELEALQADFSHDRVGASHEVMMVVKEKLPGMITSAEALAKADSLEAARSAFYDLSVPLVRWREGMAGEGRPSVAYCPMHKKSWLQPGEKIGNPYGGMPGCGQIVSK
jgi:hypothetical protein